VIARAPERPNLLATFEFGPGGRHLVLCGHIHQAPWVDGGSWHDRLGRTVVFNPGRQIGPVPPHIRIDTDAGTAEWYGVYDSETIELG